MNTESHEEANNEYIIYSSRMNRNAEKLILLPIITIEIEKRKNYD